MSENPFETPKSPVTDVPVAMEIGTLSERPQTQPVGNGWTWIREGFALFMKSPAIWIISVLIYLVIFVFLSIIPLVSLLTSLLSPVFIAGLVYGAYQLDQGKELKVTHLFEGFKRNTGSLFGVGGLYLLGLFVCMVIAMVVAFSTGAFDSFTRVASQPGAANPFQQIDMLTNMLFPGLVLMALMIPLIMAAWFAPALVIFHDMGAVEAMKRSFAGCYKNMLPFLWYGVIATVLLVVGMIPFMLGLLVVIPVLVASLYVSYKDIFID